MVADWSHLPQDLLDLIAKRLISETDILRFRSVCHSWRSSVSYPQPHRLPNCFQIHPNNSIKDLPASGFFYLSRRTIFCISLPDNDGEGDAWLIKIEQDVPEKLHLLNPLSETRTHSLPSTFPKPLNLIDFQISELGQEYILRYSNRRPILYLGDVYREKVVLSSNSAWDWSSEIDNVIMTIHVSRKLAFFRLKENRWTIIEEDEGKEGERSPYTDLIHYRGQFYAVGSNGRTVVVDPSLTMVTEIVPPIFDDERCKSLVEFDGELYMIDRYSIIGPTDVPDYFFDEDNYIIDKTVWFKVFKLDQIGQRWVEVKSLGDHVLFLGDNCSFSASARDLPGCKGNCIYFTDIYYHMNWEYWKEHSPFKCHYINVFNLAEDGSNRIGPVASYPGYSEIFWPPPSWVMSNCEFGGEVSAGPQDWGHPKRHSSRYNSKLI